MASGESLIQRILKSTFFAKVMRRGAALTKNRALLLVFLQQGVSKMESRGVAEGIREVKDQLQLMIRLIKAYATGEYRDVAARSSGCPGIFRFSFGPDSRCPAHIGYCRRRSPGSLDVQCPGKRNE